MNVRERAAADAKAILERGGCASATAVIHFENGNKTVTGDLNDTDKLLEKGEGQIPAREAFFTCSAASLPEIPKKNVKVDFNELSGKPLTLYVSRAEHDRVIGVCRLVLSTEPEPEYRD